MSWTKKELILSAFDELALGSYEFDLDEGQFKSALGKLDAMMATWNGKGIRLGYPLYSNKDDSILDEASNVPDWSYEAIYQNLAIRIAPSFGKVVSPDLKQNAKDGYDAIMTRTTRPPEMQITGLPKGQGHKSSRYTSSITLSEPDTVLTDGSGDTLLT